MNTNSKLSYKSVVIKDDSKEFHLKKLDKLSLKSIGEIPQLEEPDYWQKVWVLFRLSHSNTWPKVHENKIGDFKNWK